MSEEADARAIAASTSRGLDAALCAAQPRPVHLLGMLPSDLVAHLAAHGVACRDDEARRILARVISDGQDDLSTMKRPVQRAVRLAVDATTRRAPLTIVERAVDPADGFVKYLLRHDDGALTEAVRIPLHIHPARGAPTARAPRSKPGAHTVCLSSQVGCAMQCAFCATGRLGLTRSLQAWEIVAAFCAVRDDVARDGGRVTGAVFMGQGEPFHNYDEVIQAARVLAHPCGGRIAAEAITISTVGLVPQIRRYTAEGHPFRLVVSLTSAVPERRKTLLPIAGSFAMEDVADAIRAHAQATGDRMTVAWVVMSGVNTGPDEVAALQALLGDVALRINLIDVNDARPDGFRRAGDDERKALLDMLQVLRAPIVRRYSGGSQRHAACGMLAATHQS